MEYGAAWLSNVGAIARHYEVMIHALERDLPAGPLRMLLVGVDNGGPLELWPSVLPEGSTVTAIDPNPNAARLGPNVLIGRPDEPEWLLSALGRESFDVVIDRTYDAGESVWPWLSPGGKLFLEDVDPEDASLLAADVAFDRPSWLPTEEIMRLTVFPHVLVVEKRDPRVIPYIEIMTGNFADVVPEAELVASGVKRVLT